MNRSSVYVWVEKCKDGRVSMVDEPRSGRPIDVSTDALKERAEETILSDRRFAIYMS
jgi:transposase